MVVSLTQTIVVTNSNRPTLAKALNYVSIACLAQIHTSCRSIIPALLNMLPAYISW